MLTEGSKLTNRVSCIDPSNKLTQTKTQLTERGDVANYFKIQIRREREFKGVGRLGGDVAMTLSLLNKQISEDVERPLF